MIKLAWVLIVVVLPRFKLIHDHVVVLPPLITAVRRSSIDNVDLCVAVARQQARPMAERGRHLLEDQAFARVVWP